MLKKLHFEEMFGRGETEKVFDPSWKTVCDRMQYLCSTCALFIQFGGLRAELIDKYSDNFG